MNQTKFNTFLRKLTNSLSEKTINSLAREHGFCQRQRRLLPFKMTTCLIAALASGKIESVADIQRRYCEWSGSDVSYRAFHNQFSKPEFPDFMREVLSSLLTHWLQPAQAFPAGHAFQQFQQILIQDGSSFALKDTLRKTFPGRFKTISPAAVELQVTMDLLADQPCSIELTPDTHSERASLPEVEELTGCLLLLDRGYFDLDWFQRLGDAGGFYIARSKNTINPLVVSATREDGKSLKTMQGKTLKAVQQQLPRRQRTEMEVTWIKNHKTIHARLIAFWDKRDKQFTWLITNLPTERFSLADISNAYRLRWQIELLFKEWKSYANLHRYDTGKAPVAEGLIWAAIAAALVKRFICHSTQRIMGKVISSRKTAMSCTLLFCQMMTSLMQLDRKKTRYHARQLMIFLGRHAQRSHPKRDRRSGKFSMGLQPCEVA
jgi:hypothetical protein